MHGTSSRCADGECFGFGGVQLIASEMGLENSQVIHHHKVLDPDLYKGGWTDEEDDALRLVGTTHLPLQLSWSAKTLRVAI